MGSTPPTELQGVLHREGDTITPRLYRESADSSLDYWRWSSSLFLSVEHESFSTDINDTEVSVQRAPSGEGEGWAGPFVGVCGENRIRPINTEQTLQSRSANTAVCVISSPRNTDCEYTDRGAVYSEGKKYSIGWWFCDEETIVYKFYWWVYYKSERITTKISR